MANGFRCMHCGYQEASHEDTDFMGLACSNFELSPMDSDANRKVEDRLQQERIDRGNILMQRHRNGMDFLMNVRIKR